jgi:hypothetical protein
MEYFLFTIRPLSALLAISIFGTSVAVAEPMTVRVVDKVQAHVDATQAGETRALAVSSYVYFKDRCTVEKARAFKRR